MVCNIGIFMIISKHISDELFVEPSWFTLHIGEETKVEPGARSRIGVGVAPHQHCIGNMAMSWMRGRQRDWSGSSTYSGAMSWARARWKSTAPATKTRAWVSNVEGLGPSRQDWGPAKGKEESESPRRIRLGAIEGKIGCHVWKDCKPASLRNGFRALENAVET